MFPNHLNESSKYIRVLQPTGHRLSNLDVECLRRLTRVANVIPVIAKSDTLTLEERVAFKHNICEDLLRNQIQVRWRPGMNSRSPCERKERVPVSSEDHSVYSFQVYIGDEEEGGIGCKDIVPFCVVGSTSQHEVNGKMIFGRATRWGVVECENKAHCEFTQLRDLLIK